MAGTMLFCLWPGDYQVLWADIVQVSRELILEEIFIVGIWKCFRICWIRLIYNPQVILKCSTPLPTTKQNWQILFLVLKKRELRKKKAFSNRPGSSLSLLVCRIMITIQVCSGNLITKHLSLSQVNIFKLNSWVILD